jgi:flagellar protein FlbB
MAKSKIRQENTVTHEQKSPGIFQKLFFWFIIPLLFIMAILLVVASFTNFNIFEKATELTSISTTDELSAGEMTESYNKKVLGLEAEVKEKEAEIDNLNKQLEEAKAANQESLIMQEQLQYEIEKLQRQQDEAKKEFDDILKTFEKMSAKAAAPILVEMNDEQAVKILANMSPDNLSAILAKMEPAEAARYTELLSQVN